MKYPKVGLGQIEAMINKHGGVEGMKKFLRGETVVLPSSCCWREQNGVIYVTVISDGTTGPQWKKRLNQKMPVLKEAEEILLSDSFNPTNRLVMEIAILRGILFDYNSRMFDDIRAEAERRGLKTPNPEVACLLSEKLSIDLLKALELRFLVVMHEEVTTDSYEDGLLTINSLDDLYQGDLRAYPSYDGSAWEREDGFAFLVSSTYL